MLSTFNTYYHNYYFRESNMFLVWKDYALLEPLEVMKLSTVSMERTVILQA